MAATLNKWFQPKTWLDKTFEYSIIAKGIDGLLELIGGLLVWFAPETINRAVVTLTQHELSEDPRDFIAGHLIHSTQHLASSPTFAAIYLLAHGLVKIILVIALLRKITWAYPVMIVFLFVFILYQSYRFGVTHGVGLLFLTAFDFLIVALTWREYRKLQTS